MGKRMSMKSKRQEAPQWVFSWRSPPRAPFVKGLSWLLVGTAFAFFLTSMRIRVTPPKPWEGRKATLIQIADDAMGRILTLQAREGGPFPSRFEPAEWSGMGALERAAMEAARWSPPAYVPVLRDLPVKHSAPPVLMAAKGEPVLPKRSQAEADPRGVGNFKLTPVLALLSGMPRSGMPDKLPPFHGAVGPAMTSEPWRFLLCLDSAGVVRDCVSLAGGNEAGPTPLEIWLRGVAFNPDTGKKSRWITVEIEFTNQAADGPVVR